MQASLIANSVSVLVIVLALNFLHSPSMVFAPPTLEECINQAWDQKILSGGTDWRSTQAYTARRAGLIHSLFPYIVEQINAQQNRQITLNDFSNALDHVRQCFQVRSSALKYQAPDAFRMCGGLPRQSGARDGPQVAVMSAVNFLDAVLLALYGEQYIRAKAAAEGTVVIPRSVADRLFPNGVDAQGRVVFE